MVRIISSVAIIFLCVTTLTLLYRSSHDQPARAAERKTTEQRAEAGPYIAVTKAISKDETVRVLVIPHPLGEFFDVTCVIYTNREVGTATMNCPTAHQGEISVPENR